MSLLTPEPQFSLQWWCKQKIGGNPFLEPPRELLEFGALNDKSWIMFFGDDEDFTTAESCIPPLVFPSPTDVIHWLRLLAMPYALRYAPMNLKAVEVLQCIDSAPPGSYAEKLLQEVQGMLAGIYRPFRIAFVTSVHEWLSAQDQSYSGLHFYFHDPEKEKCVNGRWVLKPNTWRGIEKRLRHSNDGTLWLCADDVEDGTFFFEDLVGPASE